MYVEGLTKFLQELINVSVHSTKIAANEAMVDRFTTLLGKIDKKLMCSQPDFKV